jgi:hypothetical protein
MGISFKNKGQARHDETKDRKQRYLNMFKSFVLLMREAGAEDDHLESFSNNPCPENFGMDPDPYSPRDAIFIQIKRNTSATERLGILEEMANSGEI